MVLLQKRFAVLLALLSIWSGPLQAVEDADHKARLGVAETIVKTEAAGRLQDQILGMMGKQFTSMMIAKNPGKEKEVSDLMKEAFAEMSNRKDEVNDQIVGLYAKHFTLDELRQMLTYKKSPLGQKLEKVMPEIMRQSMLFGQQWGQKIAQEILERIRKRASQRGLKL